LRFEFPFGGLEATHAVHLRLIGKSIVDFPLKIPLVIIDLLSLSVTTEALRVKIDRKSPFFKRVGQFLANFDLVGDIPREPFMHEYIGQ